MNIVPSGFSLPQDSDEGTRGTKRKREKTQVRRALLIGIDKYEEARPPSTLSLSNLSGCVHDVNAIEDFLSGIEGCTTTKLTASRPQTSGAKQQEAENTSPTFRNIVDALKRLSEECQPGDLVYIHYSGHGLSRQDKALPSDGGSELGGMALVPSDALVNNKYITGRYLGVIVQKIAAVAENVFVVLDSCFSGGGFRDTKTHPGFAPRCNEHFYMSQEIMASADSEIESTSINDTPWRNTTAQSDWFSNPSKCTIITACGRNETAGESLFKIGKEKMQQHGALTYWMLDILKRSKDLGLMTPTCSQIRKHVQLKTSTGLCSKSGGSNQVFQSPSIVGNQHVEFFGNRRVANTAFCHVTRVFGGMPTLNVGEVHGIFAGAVFEIVRQRDSVNGRGNSIRICKTKISKPKLFSSTGEKDPTIKDKSMLPQEGDIAILETLALPGPFKIRLINADVEFQTSFTTEVAAVPNMEIFDESTGKSESDIQITIKVQDDSTLEFRDRDHQRIGRLPTVSCKSNNAAKKASRIVQHLARYMVVERKLNDLRAYNSSKIRLDVQLSQLNEEIEDEPGVDDVLTYPECFKDVSQHCESSGVQYCQLEHGDSVYLTLRSPKCQDNCWVTIIELNATWQIEKKYPSEHDAVEILDPIPLQIEGQVPAKYNDMDPDHCVDKYFVIVVSGKSSTSWDMLNLPSMLEKDSLLLLNQEDDMEINEEIGEDEKRGKFTERKITGWETPERLWIHPFEVRISKTSNETK